MADSSKIQRWLDLVVALLGNRTGLTFEKLEGEVPGYGNTSKDTKKSKDAKKQMFERDKRELKAFGIPIQTIGEEGDAEARYRLATTDFYLPYLALTTPHGVKAPRKVDRYGYHALTTLTFDADELAAVVDAAHRARQLGDPALAADVDSAVRKLAFDLPVDSVGTPDEARILPERASASPAVLSLLGDALIRRKHVAFDYHSMGRDVKQRREVEPYGLAFLNGHWYLVARDVALGELRNFRVSRIAGAKVHGFRPESPDYAIPAGFRLREHAGSRQAWELGDGDAIDAVVEFRDGSGAALAAAALGRAVDGAPSRRVFRIRRLDTFARWLLSLAGEAVPVAPAPVVEEFRRLVSNARALYADAEVAT